MRPDFCDECGGTLLPCRALVFETKSYCCETCLAIAYRRFMEARDVPKAEVPDVQPPSDVRG